MSTYPRSQLLAFTMALLFAGMSSEAFAQPQKCGGADIATGPFTYSNFGSTSATFNGSVAASVLTGFTVYAPAPSPQTDAADVFAGQGQNACLGEALAAIQVMEVQKVGDSNGDPLGSPETLDVNSGLGLQIASAFSIDPNSHVFLPGSNVAVTVTVTNPNVAAADYGDYDIKLGAQAPGAGIGVGSGFHFSLSLRASSVTDTTPPVVTVTKPASDQILGAIPVEVQAYDPVGPAATGLVSLTASISSSGGTISSVAIPLTLDASLPVGPGVTVTGTGTFAPRGGAPSDTRGTTEALAFTAALTSGIGTYTISGRAEDGASNVGFGTKTFNVKYDVAFLKQSSTQACGGNGPGSGPQCTGQFQWTVNRSSVTSDGAFMWDKTVIAELRTAGNQLVATHVFGTGDIKDVVLIEDGVYKTNFRRSTIGASSAATYTLSIYFLNVDGTQTLQAVSNSVTF